MTRSRKRRKKSPPLFDYIDKFFDIPENQNRWVSAIEVRNWGFSNYPETSQLVPSWERAMKSKEIHWLQVNDDGKFRYDAEGENPLSKDDPTGLTSSDSRFPITSKAHIFWLAIDWVSMAVQDAPEEVRERLFDILKDAHSEMCRNTGNAEHRKLGDSPQDKAGKMIDEIMELAMELEEEYKNSLPVASRIAKLHSN